MKFRDKLVSCTNTEVARETPDDRLTEFSIVLQNVVSVYIIQVLLNMQHALNMLRNTMHSLATHEAKHARSSIRGSICFDDECILFQER